MENQVEIEKEKDKAVKLTLIRLGIKCDHMGFGFLVEAIKETIENSKLANNLRKLFTIVAEKCGAKDFFRVEANIHNAIVSAYKARGFDYLNKLYEMQVIKPNRKPNTAEMIRLVAECYTMGLYKKKIEYVETPAS